MARRSIGIALACLALAGSPPAIRAQTTSPTPTATPFVRIFTKKNTQAKIMYLPSGGRIDLTPVKRDDTATLGSLRDHAGVLEEQLRRGDFSMLFKFMKEDSEFLEWTKKNEDAVKITVSAPVYGLRVDLITKTAPARTAVHAFLHRIHPKPAGPDEATPSKNPGRDLGRDANLKVPKK